MAEGFDGAPNPFWDFSIAVYRHPGIADACIALQEKLGIDVNVLLYFAWLGSAHGCTLGADQIAAVVDYASGWHDGVVRPLRALRTAMKGDAKGAPAAAAERLRAQIKSAELNAERIEQEMLYAARPKVEGSSATSLEAARANIASYFQRLGVAADSADWAAVESVLRVTTL